MKRKNSLKIITNLMTALLILAQTMVIPSWTYADISKGKMDVAVVEFNTKGNINIQELGALGATCQANIATGIDQTGKFNLKERVSLNQILKEMNLKSSGIIDDKTILVGVKKITGLDAVIVGDVSQSVDGKNVSIDVRLVNAATGDIIKTAGITCPSDANVIRVACEKLAYLLSEMEIPSKLVKDYEKLVEKAKPAKPFIVIDAGGSSTIVWVLIAVGMIATFALSGSKTTVTQTNNN